MRSADIQFNLRPNEQTALDLCGFKAIDGPCHLGIRHAGGAEFHPVQTVQLDWAGIGFHQYPQRGQLARGVPVSGANRAREPIHLVDGGYQKRAFTDIDDGIDALMRIIENPNGIASGKIYNIGNPENECSVRELARTMLALASEFPEYAPRARQVRLVETSSGAYYGGGYQDMQARAPKIDNTRTELGWNPQMDMNGALRKIFEAYRDHVADAQALIEYSIFQRLALCRFALLMQSH